MTCLFRVRLITNHTKEPHFEQKLNDNEKSLWKCTVNNISVIVYLKLDISFRLAKNEYNFR